MSSPAVRLAQLRRHRPRRNVLRASGLVLVAVVSLSWAAILLQSPVLSARPERLRAFLLEIVPYPMRAPGASASDLWSWFRSRIAVDLLEAVSNTVALAWLAIVGAATVAAIGCWAASRHHGWEEPYLAPSRSSVRRWARRGGRILVRLLFVFWRGVPVYAWAFVLVATMGAGAWPALFALVLHNAGILGRLFADSVDDIPREAAVRSTVDGSGRWRTAADVVFPQVRARWLLYAAYRFETCVREATALGLLGVTSLGWFVAEARAGQRLDELFAWIVIGAVLILASDAVSWHLRRRLRRPPSSGRVAAIASRGPQPE